MGGQSVTHLWSAPRRWWVAGSLQPSSSASRFSRKSRPGPRAAPQTGEELHKHTNTTTTITTVVGIDDMLSYLFIHASRCGVYRQVSFRKDAGSHRFCLVLQNISHLSPTFMSLMLLLHQRSWRPVLIYCLYPFFWLSTYIHCLKWPVSDICLLRLQML